VDEIQAIADRHGLKVIYDAAHAFGVRYRGRSLLSFGDFASLSFHATKAFNTFEGGAIVAGHETGKRAVDSFRNFGIASEVSIPALGTNAKMSEFNAALGLLQLDHFEAVRAARGRVDQRYRELLADLPGLSLLDIPQDVEPNYSYFPVLVRPDFRTSRDGLYEDLKAAGIMSRRYFYPLLSSLDMYRHVPSAAPDRLPVAWEAAEQILCLPIYPDLGEEDQRRIAAAVAGSA
jgi:dTDP-4-amino-4,6-dideoxygalactose transaminase